MDFLPYDSNMWRNHAEGKQLGRSNGQIHYATKEQFLTWRPHLHPADYSTFPIPARNECKSYFKIGKIHGTNIGMYW
jgi:hypothetical protein